MLLGFLQQLDIRIVWTNHKGTPGKQEGKGTSRVTCEHAEPSA